MVEEIPTATESVDPRVKRTRHMLHDALERLLESKSIEKISVGDIAGEATLNRATFYGHYRDKFALLEGLVASRFQNLLDKRGVVFHGGCSTALRRIILATCEYLAGLPGVDCPNRRQMEKNFESAIIAVVRRIILSGMQNHPSPNAMSRELVAATMSGAIYGGAREWIQTSNRVPVEEVVESIFLLVTPIGATVLPHDDVLTTRIAVH